MTWATIDFENSYDRNIQKAYSATSLRSQKLFSLACLRLCFFSRWTSPWPARRYVSLLRSSPFLCFRVSWNQYYRCFHFWHQNFLLFPCLSQESIHEDDERDLFHRIFPNSIKNICLYFKSKDHSSSNSECNSYHYQSVFNKPLVKAYLKVALTCNLKWLAWTTCYLYLIKTRMGRISKV